MHSSDITYIFGAKGYFKEACKKITEVRKSIPGKF